ncbi:MAG: sulfatase-like hydrolase/transferase [Thermococcus sp.]|uniref:sulfatase-like hydrolase/transferase n=1 Tax=Thermococcus sp. TaxID=35749 RepID=UPI001D83F62D|nr:sulfatase-like hydrolase/transferase [Thermococcus sp.]MBO8175042.1 sulfatase-like hydrolase/transferase [Thermococcus sp.]
MNIIFIVIDTLRKDYSTAIENELKRLGFTTYENTIAPSSWTIPTHASIFTGLYPALHDAHETKNKKIPHIKLKSSDNLISLQVKDLGYETKLLTANPFIRPSFGFTGFDYFYEVSHIPTFRILSSSEREIINTLIQKYQLNGTSDIIRAIISQGYYKLLLKASLKMLIKRPYLSLWKYYHIIFENWPTDKGAKRIVNTLKKITKTTSTTTQKFIFMNLMEVHEPYYKSYDPHTIVKGLKRGKFETNEIQKWKEGYCREIKYITTKILDIIHVLKERGLFRNSLIIITSDHGQLLGEYGKLGHGTFLYDELLRVPLLIKYPEDHPINHEPEELKYISLTKLKQFIFAIINNQITSDTMLYDDTVFAESYGIQENVGKMTSDEEKKNIEQLEKYRLAIYYKNFKGIFNVTDWKFEEIISYNPKIEVTEDIIKHMKKEVVKFLKTATVAKVPKIKI